MQQPAHLLAALLGRVPLSAPASDARTMAWPLLCPLLSPEPGLMLQQTRTAWKSFSMYQSLPLGQVVTLNRSHHFRLDAWINGLTGHVYGCMLAGLLGKKTPLSMLACRLTQEHTSLHSKTCPSPSLTPPLHHYPLLVMDSVRQDYPLSGCCCCCCA